MKLSDRNWKPFYLSELFEIKGSKTTNISIIKKSKQGKYPYITTQTNNNAQAGYYNFYTEKGNILVIDSAVVGFCTYQFYNFTASDHVEKLIPKFKINKYIALFLTTQINKNNSKKFNYGFKACQNRLKNTPIFLPIDKKGNPDYKFMETYMREKENKLKNQYKQFISLRLKNEYKKPVNQKKWKVFCLNDLFNIELSQGDNQAKLLLNGNYPLVSAGNTQNGICKYIKQGDKKSQLFNNHLLTIDMFGKVFFQPAKFYAVSHGRINILIPKFKINKYIALFIISTLEKKTLNRYSFSHMCNKRRLYNETIYLPITKNLQPDYAFMENYMRYLEQKKLKAYLDYLNK